MKLNVSLPLKESSQNLVIVGSISINGILCVTSMVKEERKVVLWNPTIEELKVIPHSPVEYSFPRVAKPRIHAFGYDYVRDDYRLIRYVQFGVVDLSFENEEPLTCEEMSYDPLWEIYSLSSNSWRLLGMKMPTLIVPLGDVEIFQFYMAGMCHWQAQKESHLERCYDSYLVSFDVTNEVFFYNTHDLGLG